MTIIPAVGGMMDGGKFSVPEPPPMDWRVPMGFGPDSYGFGKPVPLGEIPPIALRSFAVYYLHQRRDGSFFYQFEREDKM